MENYLKIANKLLRGITDTDLLKSEIWSDIVAKVKVRELQLWEYYRVAQPLQNL